jgi:hypothetical protein
MGGNRLVEVESFAAAILLSVTKLGALWYRGLKGVAA